MKAISLWQPWASAIPAGLKKIETRHWAPPATIIGHLIAIHAAKRFTFEERQAFCIRTPTNSAEDLAFCQIGVRTADELPLGCVVAIARLAGCQRTEDIPSFMLDGGERIWGDYRAGRYGWFLREVRPLPTPIPCVGRQGFFDWEPPPEAVLPEPITP